jgi:serine protease
MVIFSCTLNRTANYWAVQKTEGMDVRSIKVPTLLRGIASVMLPLTIAACGGSGHSGEGPDADTSGVTSEATTAEVAAAASAAASENVSTEIAMKMNADSVKDDSQTDRFIVKYKANSVEGKDTSAVRSKLSRLRSAFPARANHLRRLGIGSDVVTTERKLNAKDAKAFMRAIASDPNVEYIEPDVEMQAQTAPNDPYYSWQWYLTSNLTPGNKSAGIRAEGAWDIAKGRGSVIGIIDTGVTSHSDLNANLLPGYTFVGIARQPGGFDNGYAGGSCAIPWHGTHVAGIAAALMNNGVGVAGVAPEAKILPVKPLGACGNGAMSDVADSITWAAGGTLPGIAVNPNPATVINLSLAQKNMCSQTMQSVIDYATSQGAIVIAAAGNDSEDVAVWQPANCRNVISVGGTGAGSIGSWVSSNFGPGIDIAAPASEIWSTYDSGTSTPVGDSYHYMSGTSMATPMVSGVIALAQSVAPAPLTVAEYRSLLRQNVQPFAATPDRALGPGVLDAAKTVAAAKSGVIPVAADFTCQQDDSLYMGIHCQDLTSARSGVPIKTRVWNFGSSSTSTDTKDPLHIYYKYSGTYPITLTVTDNNGQVSSITRSIKVTPPPTVNLPLDTPVPLSGNYADVTFFQTTVPAGAKSLTFSLNIPNVGEAVSIHVNDGPSDIQIACAVSKPGPNTASCTVNAPKAGVWYGRYFISSSSLSGGTATVTVN